MAEGASSSAGAPEPETQQFGNVLLAGKDQHREENLGTLRMHSGGFGWKSKKTGHVIAISKSDLRGAEWAKAPPYACMLKLRAKGGFSHTFVGLRSQDRGVVGDYCARVFELDLKDVAFSWKGWNWGEALVEGTSLAFRVEDNAALEIPLSAVSQAIASTRKEAIIELADDDTAAPEDEMVVGIRFHVPAAARDDEADEEELAPAETLVAQIKESGDLEASGTSLATFEDVGLTVPRGRYDIEMFDKFLKLHGKTYDYKVLYTNVASVYVLPKQDNYTMAFVVSLEHPLRQGATMYPHIVMQLPRDATVDLEIALEPAELRRRFDDKLERSESGELVDLLPKVMCAFTKKKVVRPKVGGFNGEKEDKFKSIRCSLKANDGFLYPLDKCFFFVANKPLHIDFERIGSLEFNRVDKAAQAQSARTFDITLYMRDGSSHQFVNLQRSDYKELFAFLQGKQIKIRNLAAANKANADDADDESDGGDEDPYMDRIKRQRASSSGAADGMGADDDDDDDDDSEEDADFAPGEESDVDEEYEEGGGGGGSDDERAGSSKKKGKKKAESSGSDSGSDSDSDAPKKKKAKPAAKAKASPKKKPQKKKDKDAPKRGMSAFMLWMNASRASIKEEHPDAKVTDIGRIAGAKWKEMDAEAKAPWDAKAKADKERYEAEMKAYKAKQRASLAADDSDSSEAAAPAKPAAGSDSDSD